MHIKQWLELKPLDTLFFRGGEPMVAGETHEAGKPVFPPVPETIIGALRAAILAQKGIAPEGLETGKPLENLPYWGTPEEPGFRVLGPLLKVRGVVLFPAPASWFYVGKGRNRLEVREARPEKHPPVKLSREKPLWIEKPLPDMEPLSGKFWLTRKALENEGGFELDVAGELRDISEDEALAVPTKFLIRTEERVGIARDNIRRAVKTGHLYASRHLRFTPEVSLVVGLDKPLCPSHLKAEGVFQLGGEGRLVRYRRLNESEIPEFPENGRGRVLVLSPLLYTRAERFGLLKFPYASGKLLRVGGWDMRKGFHKPARAYFPAGAVFYTEEDYGLCELMPF
ncbi:type III-B CRISPR module-associated Cmr3 family protein [Thermosulfurimonas sp. F29]|uniref:type III-B CRISPR module-associated Cmr3 family protein n=1 Tax=Thermosulfurimonas sp. F29 TaxID=2867247 RepID=UPI001C831A4F|nr:type III-B CRISPR module-associated Cmr3 family protein [Thermosulfurimonas sp. F29]MBX6423231.1 hypothetical protein [Thermosulfurimonas sp. F29]